LIKLSKGRSRIRDFIRCAILSSHKNQSQGAIEGLVGPLFPQWMRPHHQPHESISLKRLNSAAISSRRVFSCSTPMVFSDELI
jgi:hypothetical protein